MNPPVYFTTLPSPLGELTLAATEAGLCGLYFPGHKYLPAGRGDWRRDDGAAFDDAREWLRRYFRGEKPGRLPVLTWLGGTEFQRRVWRALEEIPSGATRTYRDIAQAAGAGRAVRAAGAAIGRNPLSLFVPCHRVVGGSGALTGYAGGVERKRWLLAHEGACLEQPALFGAASAAAA